MNGSIRLHRALPLERPHDSLLRRSQDWINTGQDEKSCKSRNRTRSSWYYVVNGNGEDQTRPEAGLEASYAVRVIT
eukprot:CAMPEP_0203801476 /NCGR_PEP_ID=MMETSP0100_2-20121128/11328_1 /ASSEMBLY_ACC=CAM_ASM_000210 /TAXON_ID=96639 /ORGANISM=" , Strain NY0313808BC1" /LENGTH=75 /DNA_ID=CAMNT_0050708143 /DNA_START=16 /DNA_END=240 /DNA_ORIENTATION=+